MAVTGRLGPSPEKRVQKVSYSQAIVRAKKVYDDRRRRDREMQPLNIFGEPAWDILLMLFTADDSAKAISLSTIYAVELASATTMVRWLRMLESKALIEQTSVRGVATDVKLTPAGNELLMKYFSV